MKKYTFKEKISYKFDEKMAKGTGSRMMMLGVSVLAIVLLIAIIITAGGMNNGENFIAVFWDSLTTTINAWMPASEDGGVGYVLLMAVAAIVGVVFTSFLIGIFSTAIEEKLTSLRKGHSRVLETGHTIILGFEIGEFELIKQLISAAGDKNEIIVVGGSEDKDLIEDAIAENVKCPKNIKIICRHVEPGDVPGVACCSPESAKRIVVAGKDEGVTIRQILATVSILREKKAKVPIITAVTSNECILPDDFCQRNNVIMIQTADLMARLIAHSCCEPGLAEVFCDVFDFDNNVLTFISANNLGGLTFGNVFARIDRASLIGVAKGENTFLNPPHNMIIDDSDFLICFTNDASAISFVRSEPEEKYDNITGHITNDPAGKVLIIGKNDMLDLVCNELPKDAEITKTSEIEGFNLENAAFAEDLSSYNHIIVLDNEEGNDVDKIVTLFKLRALRLKLNLHYNITVEMHNDFDLTIVRGHDNTDFIITSNITSMILAQIAVNPVIYATYSELLSNDGTDLFMIPMKDLGFGKSEETYYSLRMAAFSQNVIMLGVLKDGEAILNLKNDDRVQLDGSEMAILLGESSIID